MIEYYTAKTMYYPTIIVPLNRIHSPLENCSDMGDSSGNEERDVFYGRVHIASLAVCTVLIFFAILMGCIGNGIVLYSAFKWKKLRTNFDVLVINLTGADFITCSCLTPVFLILLFVDPPTPKIFCGSILFLGTISAMLSLLTLVAIALHRLARVIGHARGTTSLTRIGIIIVLIWIVSLVLSIGGTFHMTTDWDGSFNNCQPIINSPNPAMQNFVLYFLAPVTIVSFSIITLSYIIIAWVVQKQVNSASENNSPRCSSPRENIYRQCRDLIGDKRKRCSPTRPCVSCASQNLLNKDSKAVTMCLVVILTMGLCWGPMADWEEVKRLAADFQRAQLSSTKQKLSERNVVELVAKLLELKLIDVIYTLDGKEYLTPQELTKEIRDELLVHGGRINLVELQQILNVDFSHIETKVSEMVKNDKSLMLVLGQLVDKNYLDSLAEEVNDKLQEKGHVTVGEITKQYDLPADFISEHIHARIGRIIRGQVDSYDKNVIFTDAFLKRMKAQIRGAFSAITRPTTVMNVMNRYSFQERLFFSILEELIHSKRLQGIIVGGHQEKAVYIPDIYTKAQNQWVDNFYQQNGYLEYDSLVRLGITDPKAFIKKRFKTEPLTYLGTCCAGVGIKDQIEASVEEALAENSWADIMPLLPSVFSMEDGSQLLADCLRKHQLAVQCCHTIVTSHKFLEKCRQPFKEMVAKKAEEDARNNPSLFTADTERKGGKSLPVDDFGPSKEDKKDQRRKKQAGATKSGGGTQGREVKTKATKKKYNKGRGDHGNDSDEEDHGKKVEEAVEFMPVDKIESELRKHTDLMDCPEEFITEIATQLYRPLCREYQELGKSIFLTSAGVDTGTGRKKTHGELQEKIAGLWTNCKLFEKGLKLFSEDIEAQLVKHLLKSVCSDIVNIVVCAIGSENMLSVPDDSNLTTENRAKMISKLPENVQSVLTKLHMSLNGKTLDDFYSGLDVICGPEHLGVLLKKPDKRKERQLIFNHRQALLENLKCESDPAMLLHLASVILFQMYTQTMIHAPGKCVPQVIAHLQPHMEVDKHQKLIKLQDLVVKHMKLQGPDKEAEILEMKTEMEQLMSEIRDIVMKTKKGAQSSEEPTS